MAYKRPPIESLEFDVRTGQKKYVRYNEGATLYSMGVHGFMDLAKEAVLNNLDGKLIIK